MAIERRGRIAAHAARLRKQPTLLEALQRRVDSARSNGPSGNAKDGVSRCYVVPPARQAGAPDRDRSALVSAARGRGTAALGP